MSHGKGRVTAINLGRLIGSKKFVATVKVPSPTIRKMDLKSCVPLFFEGVRVEPILFLLIG
jgi:hypothetical protein